MDIKDIKLFLRIDNDEEDDFLQGLLKASELYLENAGCKKNYDNELYSLAVKLLVSHWYENRCITGNLGYLEFSLNSIITQLRDVKIKDEEETNNEEQ